MLLLLCYVFGAAAAAAAAARLHVLDVYEARLSCSVYEARSTRLHVLELEPKWLPQHTFSTLHVLTRFAPQVESCASKLSYTCYIDIWCLSWVAGLLPSPYMHQASCINICNMRICYPLGCLKLRESATSPPPVIMCCCCLGLWFWYVVSCFLAVCCMNGLRQCPNQILL